MNKMNRNWYSLRWQVLNRDRFTCQYCGRGAPDVVLHVDHKEAQTNGGDDSLENLVTACSACNIGKNLRPLGIPSVPLTSIGKRKPLVIKEIINYLSASDNGATAMEMAKALGHDRTNISRILNANPSVFRKLRRKASVYFSLV